MTREDVSDSRLGHWPWHLYLIVLAGYSFLTLAMTYPLVLEFGRAIPGDSFDGWQNYWNLWWVREALIVQGSSPLYTDMLFHPTGVSLAFHTLNIFNGLFTLPIGLTLGLFPAYNTVVLLSFIAGAFGAFLLSRYTLAKAGWNGRWTVWPAFLAGVVYGFSPFHFAHLLGHMQVFSLQWIPFAVLGLLMLLDRSRLPGWPVGMAGLTGLFLVLMGACDWYFALYVGFFTGIVLLYRLAARSLTLRGVLMVLLAWGVFLIVLAPMWIPMAREAGQSTYMVPEREQALALSADLLAFFTPNEFHPLWGEAAGRFASRFTSTLSERQVFAGYLPLALGFLAAIKTGRRSRFWWLATLGLAILALGPILHIGGRSSFTPAGITIPLPYALLYDAFPFIRIARSIARLDVMVMLSLGTLSAIGLAYLTSRIRQIGWRPALVGLPAIAIVCFEFLSMPYPFSPPDTPAYYHEIAAEPVQDAVLNLPMNWDRPGYLLYQTVHGKPLTAAYISRDDPRTLVYRAPVLQEFRRLGRDILADHLGSIGPSVLDWLQVRYVVLDRYKMPGGREREVTFALADELFGGQAPVFEDERIIVFRVQHPQRPAPFAVLGQGGWGPPEEHAGQPWRAVTGEAQLLIQSEGGRPLQLKATLRAERELTIRMMSDQGDDVVLSLSPAALESRFQWTPAGPSSTLTLLSEDGEASFWVSGVRVSETEAVPVSD